MPFFIKWPGHIEPGTRYDAPVGHLDILPTAAAAAGASLPQDRVIDGVDVLPFVQGTRDGVPHRTLFWREGYHQVVLDDGWKLIVTAVPEKKWLFNLRDDPTERREPRGLGRCDCRAAAGVARCAQQRTGEADMAERDRIAAADRQDRRTAVRRRRRIHLLAELMRPRELQRVTSGDFRT